MIDREVERANEIRFEAFGVSLGLSASEPQLLERMREMLPPGARLNSSSAVERRFHLGREDSGTYELLTDGKVPDSRGLELDLALEVLDTQLRLYLGRKSRDAIFIHAGVVARDGVTIVIPGASFAGKTTLVTALVREGAIYYSDEFAVIGRDGLIQPYAKRLSVRNGGMDQTHHEISSMGGVAGDESLPLGMIVITSYQRGAEWRPKRRSPGGGAMALLSNAVPAKERPKEVMEAISRAAEGAVVIESDRGEADEIAPLLLAELERGAS